MTTTASTTALPGLPAGVHHDSLALRYGHRWARVPRELGYLLVTGAISLLVLLVWLGLLDDFGPFGPYGIAVPLIVLLLAASRRLGRVELLRQRWARTPAIPEPRRRPLVRGRRGVAVLADGHTWLSVLHALVLNPPLAAVTGLTWSLWIGAGLALTSFAAWGRALPFPADGTALPVHGFFGPVPVAGKPIADAVTEFLTGRTDAASVVWFTIGTAAIGLGLLALLPFVTRAATVAHWGLASMLLARFPWEDLQEDLARAGAAHTAAIVAEDSALRRLERDIHDGPQQRLLALQIELSTAERRLASGHAEASIATARRLAAETLDELRALAQGFAPPLLQDRGLSAALGALGRRGDVPVETAIAIDGDLPDALERSVYFVAAELVTNALKHAYASRVRLDARIGESVLTLTVSDDGRGGALLGHGLSGVQARLAGLSGGLHVVSPAGGPTRITATVPLP